MSNARGTVTFVHRLKTFFILYNGTSDLAWPTLFTYSRDPGAIGKEQLNECTCESPEWEQVIVTNDYGTSHTWVGDACYPCRTLHEDSRDPYECWDRRLEL